LNKAWFSKKRKPNHSGSDLYDVTLGSPAILSANDRQKPESAFEFKTRGFPSSPHGEFGFLLKIRKANR
jgi:hypothetical protein